MNYTEEKINRFAKKGVFIDTDLLLVLLIGNYKADLLGKGLTANYTKEDYDLISAFIYQFNKRYVSQPVLAEAFFHFLEGAKKIDKIYQKEFVNQNLGILTVDVDEANVSKNTTLSSQQITWLGFADINSVDCCLGLGVLLFTKDSNLCKYANEVGCEYLTLSNLKYGV